MTISEAHDDVGAGAFFFLPLKIFFDSTHHIISAASFLPMIRRPLTTACAFLLRGAFPACFQATKNVIYGRLLQRCDDVRTSQYVPSDPPHHHPTSLDRGRDSEGP